ncbi:site-specific integrase [Dyadobacter psychrotolerans]|uniref:Site-specific integrase n=1 Tax=Dyadobacter psychrotolerans TaxID=2541721 RepID=A0A4R5DUZ1_9BACT|nr:site-specific integrase [Dyadobacter psychrotolerans]TDE16334.1 site-specific integrase [Dyadobacter psychrotolerans]
MAVSTKFILRTQSSSDESEFPIMLQIIIDRKNQLVSTKKYSKQENWLKREQTVSRSHPKCREINLLLKTISSEIDFHILSEGKKGIRPGFDEIKGIVRRLTGGNTEPEKKKLFQLFDEHIAHLSRQNRIGYSDTFKFTKNSLSTFMQEKDKDLQSINLAFLLKYEEYLISRGCAITTRSVYFRTFRTLWKHAIQNKFCPETHYPFKDFPFGKYNNPRTKKRAITMEQIEAIAQIEIDPKDDALINSRNYFLFSFYSRGINFTDLASLKWENIRDGELSYIRSKTKEEFRFKLHPTALQILDYYRNLEGNSDAGYIFPILYKRHSTLRSIRDRKQKIRTRVNKDLQQLGKSVDIEKNITTYVARHTYATALRRNGISKENIGRSLGHDSLKTTDIYLEDIGDPVLDDLINSTI